MSPTGSARGALVASCVVLAPWLVTGEPGPPGGPTPPEVQEVPRPPGPASTSPSHLWPVRRPVVDAFRPPPTPFGAGNRGWEFATVPGDLVVAPTGGTVAFAGIVAGRGAVTVQFDPQHRVSLTGLVSLRVEAGEVLDAGDPLGRAAAGLHLGYRRGDTYLDPALFLPAPVRARLVHPDRLGDGGGHG